LLAGAFKVRPASNMSCGDTHACVRVLAHWRCMRCAVALCTTRDQGSAHVVACFLMPRFRQLQTVNLYYGNIITTHPSLTSGDAGDAEAVEEVSVAFELHDHLQLASLTQANVPLHYNTDCTCCATVVLNVLTAGCAGDDRRGAGW
jgi:hypothetical protein